MRSRPSHAALLAAALWLAACSSPSVSPTPSDTPGVALTQVGAPSQIASFDTPAGALTPADTGTPGPAPTDASGQPGPGTTPTLSAPTASDTPALSLATGTPSPTPGGACTNNARFVADVTVPDGTQFQPGQPIDKQWRVRNIGTCDWGPDYRLVLVSGNAMGAPSEIALYPAKNGDEAILEVNMVAPAQPGAYTGRWQARSPTAKLFGDRVFVTIDVVITATATFTPTATATAKPKH